MDRVKKKMKMASNLLRVSALLLISAVGIVAPVAFAETQWEFYQSHLDSMDWAYGTSWLAMTFRTGNTEHLANYLSLPLAKSASAPMDGAIEVSIRPVNGLVPTGNGTDIMTGSLVANTITNMVPSIVWYNVKLSPESTLQANTNYSIVVGAPSTSNYNALAWFEDTLQGYPYGINCHSSDSGNTWATYAFSFGFRVESDQTSSNASDQEQLFSWSGNLPWLSTTQPNKQHFSSYLTDKEKLRLVLSAPETVKVYIQSSDDYDKSELSGWIMIYSHWSSQTAEIDYTYSIPFTDTWYVTIWNSKTHDVYVNSFSGYRVTPSSSPPPSSPTPTASNPPIWLYVVSGVVGAVLASSLVTIYLLKVKNKKHSS